MMLGVSHLWFLMTIFECYLLGGAFDFVLNWSGKGKVKLAVACCLMIVITVHWNLPTRFLTLERVLHYFPFYLMGMMAGSMNLERYAKYRSLALAALVCSLIVLPIQHYFLHKPTCDQLIGLCVVLPFFFVLRISHVSGSSNWLNSLDKHSMGIYIIHQILQQEMNKTQVFHSLLVQHEYLYPLLQFVFLILFCWLVSALAHRSKYAKYILG